MVVRYILRCDNCGARTMLRIRVGYGDREPFAFDCRRCSQPIRGAMLLDQKAVKILGLGDLSGATEMHDFEHADYEHRHDNWFLVDSNRSDDPDAFSAFLAAMQRHGPGLFAHLQRQAALQRVIDQTRAILRTLRNYERQEWDHFGYGIAELLDETPPTSPEKRLESVMQLPSSLRTRLLPTCLASV